MNLLQAKMENAFCDYTRIVHTNVFNGNIIANITWNSCFRVKYYLSTFWRLAAEPILKITIDALPHFLSKIGYNYHGAHHGIIKDVYIGYSFDSPKQVDICCGDCYPVELHLDFSKQLVPTVIGIVQESFVSNNLNVDSRLDLYSQELQNVWDKVYSVINSIAE